MKEFHRDFANRTGLAQAWTVKSADRLFTFIGLTKNQAAQAEADNHKKIKTKPGPRPMKPKQTRKFFPKHFAKGKNLCRGGGAWTVFLSEKK